MFSAAIYMSFAGEYSTWYIWYTWYKSMVHRWFHFRLMSALFIISDIWNQWEPESKQNPTRIPILLEKSRFIRDSAHYRARRMNLCGTCALEWLWANFGRLNVQAAVVLCFQCTHRAIPFVVFFWWFCCQIMNHQKKEERTKKLHPKTECANIELSRHGKQKQDISRRTGQEASGWEPNHVEMTVDRQVGRRTHTQAPKSASNSETFQPKIFLSRLLSAKGNERARFCQRAWGH